MRLVCLALGVLLTACPTAETPAPDATPEPSPERDAKRTQCADAIDAVTLRLHTKAMKPEGAELTVIESLNARATEVCLKEGLSDAQAKCFMDAKPGSMGEGLASTRTCLGPREGWPSWFNGSGVQL